MKVLGSKATRERLDMLRAVSEGIVFTNGCFDIFHSGHARTFEWIRQRFGQYALVVGINTDKSVRKLKGKNRPIIPLLDRAAVIHAIQDVEMVIQFSDPTPLELIRAVKPTIIVKSGDYKAHEVVGYDFVKSYGGKVVIAPYFKGISTTEIINKCRTLPS